MESMSCKKLHCHFKAACLFRCQRKRQKVLWVYNYLGFVPAGENSTDVFLLYLCFIHRAFLTLTVRKPLGGITIQCPGHGSDILGVIRGHSTVDSYDIVQPLKHRVLLIVHEQLRVNRAEHGQQLSLAQVWVGARGFRDGSSVGQKKRQILF